MKNTWLKIAAFSVAAALLAPVVLNAQDDKEKITTEKKITAEQF